MSETKKDGNSSSGCGIPVFGLVCQLAWLIYFAVVNGKYGILLWGIPLSIIAWGALAWFLDKKNDKEL